MSSDSVVACLHHPPTPDVDLVRKLSAGAPRELDLRVLPFKESVKLRRARQAPPVSGALLLEAPAPSAALLEGWQEAEVLLTLDLPIERLGDMPKLKWVQAYSAGLEQFPLAALSARGIQLTNAAGAGSPAIAEFVFGRLVEIFRNLRGINAMQRDRDFHRPGGQTLAGKTLGIVGLGAIGTAVAKLGRAFEMKTIATRRSAQDGDASSAVDQLLSSASTAAMLSESDVVVLCAPATPETENLIDTAAFAQMKPGAVLCNVARGSLLDEQALCDALGSGHLGAAILDVTREEPLPAGDPLWEAPNLYLSPHSSIPPDAYDARVLALFSENLRRYAGGEPLVNLVALPDA